MNVLNFKIIFILIRYLEQLHRHDVLKNVHTFPKQRTTNERVPWFLIYLFMCKFGCSNQTLQPPPVAKFAVEISYAENSPEKFRRAELAAEFC